jgi:hypothetical protein
LLFQLFYIVDFSKVSPIRANAATFKSAAFQLRAMYLSMHPERRHMEGIIHEDVKY